MMVESEGARLAIFGARTGHGPYLYLDLDRFVDLLASVGGRRATTPGLADAARSGAVWTEGKL
jgi:hypothetical protein